MRAGTGNGKPKRRVSSPWGPVTAVLVLLLLCASEASAPVVTAPTALLPPSTAAATPPEGAGDHATVPLLGSTLRR